MDPTPEGRKVGGFGAILKRAPLDSIIAIVKDLATNDAALRTIREVYSELKDLKPTNTKM